MMLFVVLTVVCALALLVAERVRLDRSRDRIPVRVAVTGTRGKSSVTRMVASVLRESGRRVLAKTTGSEAVLILPDGTEEPVRRRGRPSILEQKRVMHLGARLRVDAVVVEMMSIHAENHYVESHRLLRPGILLATNFRVDHTAAQGTTCDEVGAVLGLGVVPGATVFVPAHECVPTFGEAVRSCGAELHEVAVGAAAVDQTTHRENLDLVYAAGRHLGLEEHSISTGIRRTRHDRGTLGMWRYRNADAVEVVLVSAFAANDPESTRIVYREVVGMLQVDVQRCVGLLTLRADRGDRSVQWLEALRDGVAPGFRHLFVTGMHARAFARRVRQLVPAMPVTVVPGTDPTELTRIVTAELRDTGGMVFGCGNFGGIGAALAAHWRTLGIPWQG
jgi:poly-gamma-glutamate synthase PgsB/CapB